jgi:hypothetical protein
MDFFFGITFLVHYGTVDDSSFNRTVYQEYFLGIKAAGE